MIGQNLGRYRIVSEIGRGGMGVVYRATQTTLDRTVAIKMLSPHLAHSSEHLARFRREAEVLARLQHECIVHIYDVEEVGGAFYIIMEYVAGPSLGEVLQREGRLDEGRVREVAVQLASGLEAAHRKGIVHRDLKPDNILFTPEGRPKITDFGIARIAGDDAMARTRTGILMGTPYYMSPEQARGGELTGASDQYSLGVLLYQMLSGRVPFEGSDPISVAIQHVQVDPPSLREAVPDLYPGLLSVVERAMRKDPSGRFPSAGEMARSLRILELGGAPEEEPWAPGPADRDGPRCPGCGGGVRVEFVTCPRCGHSLLGSGDVPLAPGAGSGTVPGESPVGAGASAPPLPEPESGTAAGAAPAGAGPLGPLGLFLHRERLVLTVSRWTRPSGRWNVPPLLWMGLVMVALGLSLGLGRALLSDRSPHPSGGAAHTPSPFQDPATAPQDPEGGGIRSGPEPWAGMVPGRQPPPSPSTRPVPTVEELIPPPSGESQPPGQDPGAPRPAASPGRTPATEGGDPKAPPTAKDSVEGREPRTEARPGFDEGAARAELREIVERQRRATEAGDEALFRRDVSRELANLHAPFLAELHRLYSQIRSEVSNLDMEFADSTMVVLDFHARVSGVRAGGRVREVIQDSHVYWLVQRRGEGWIIVDAWSEPFQEVEG
jgi:predicted Ser/Thr protein kinase